MVKTTVLIDAHCVMCNGLARFLQRRAKPSVDLDIHGIDSDEGQALISTFSPKLQAMDTVYVVRTEHRTPALPVPFACCSACAGTTPCGTPLLGWCRFR